MTTQVDQVKTLTEQVQNLKSRILDTQDALFQTQEQANDLRKTLTDIVTILGLEAVDGQIQLADVVVAVEALAKATTPDATEV